MGTPIGFFSEESSTDYPELNKCPDCETYFQTLTCPLCGKECPVEMRAGNRKTVKQKKHRRSRGNGRVQFIPWYMSAWFIIAMLVIFPLVGLILLWQSDWRRGWKIFATVLTAGGYFLGGSIIWLLLDLFTGIFRSSDIPKAPDIPQTEYAALCEQVDLEALYRQPDAFAERKVSVQLTVRAVLFDESEMQGEGYPLYYDCVAQANGRELHFLVRDLVAEGKINLMEGDRIMVWGEVEGNRRIYNSSSGTLSAPCIRMFFVAFDADAVRQTGAPTLAWGGALVNWCPLARRNRTET